MTTVEVLRRIASESGLLRVIACITTDGEVGTMDEEYADYLADADCDANVTDKRLLELLEENAEPIDDGEDVMTNEDVMTDEELSQLLDENSNSSDAELLEFLEEKCGGFQVFAFQPRREAGQRKKKAKEQTAAVA